MFIEDRPSAVAQGWRRLVDIDSTEQGLALLSLLLLSYSPDVIALGVGLVQSFAWYLHDAQAMLSYAHDAAPILGLHDEPAAPTWSLGLRAAA